MPALIRHRAALMMGSVKFSFTIFRFHLRAHCALHCTTWKFFDRMCKLKSDCHCNAVTCHISLSYVKCLCWYLGHAEQLLFSCVSSKVSICNYVTCCMSHFACHMSHCACHMSYVKCLCWFLGHAEHLLFSCVSSKVSFCNYVTCHMSHFAFHMSHVICEMLVLILGTCWTTFVFMSMLKSEYL